MSWLFGHSAFLFTLRQTVQQQDQDGSSRAYARAFSRMVDRGLTSDEWAPIERFYRDLKALGDKHGFVTLSVIMPVNAVVGQSHAENHPFAVEARRRLDALGIPYLDAFTLWSKNGYGVKPFLPQGPDGHLNADGYRLIADAIAERLLSTPAMANALKADPELRSRAR
jgi:lysophospholipase L1-like esterase